MSIITKESIADTIEGLELLANRGIQSVHIDMAIAGMRRLLASLEAEAVAWRYRTTDINGNPNPDWSFSEEASLLGLYQPLYAAPPAPASVPEWTNEQCMEFLSIAFRHAEINGDLQLEDIRLGVKMVNGSRAAMLPGADGTLTNEGTTPANTPCKLRDAVDAIRNSGIAIDAEKILAEREALNAPDCWCRTCRPITLTDMRFVVCPDCGNKRCPHANDHRNACSGSNEPGQEGSAYPAAPQQEVK